MDVNYQIFLVALAVGLACTLSIRLARFRSYHQPIEQATDEERELAWTLHNQPDLGASLTGETVANLFAYGLSDPWARQTVKAALQQEDQVLVRVPTPFHGDATPRQVGASEIPELIDDLVIFGQQRDADSGHLPIVLSDANPPQRRPGVRPSAAFTMIVCVLSAAGAYLAISATPNLPGRVDLLVALIFGIHLAVVDFDTRFVDLPVLIIGTTIAAAGLCLQATTSGDWMPIVFGTCTWAGACIIFGLGAAMVRPFRTMPIGAADFWGLGLSCAAPTSALVGAVGHYDPLNTVFYAQLPAYIIAASAGLALLAVTCRAMAFKVSIRARFPMLPFQFAGMVVGAYFWHIHVGANI